MIETARLRLRKWRAEHRASLIALCQSPEVMEFLGGPATEEQVDAGLARMKASQQENGYCFWAMERRDDSAFLGFCGLKITDVAESKRDREVEIAWRLRKDAWGQGYAREAALATLRWAWANLDVPRIIAMTVPTNRRSWGLMERIGMVRRPELDFGHPSFPERHPLHRHIVYVANRPARASA